MQTIQFKVDNNYIDIVLSLVNTLNSLKLNVINDLLIIDNKRKEINVTSIDTQYITNEKEELKSFSNHTANLIEEWKGEDEDRLWI
jgi:hypothetical protein